MRRAGKLGEAITARGGVSAGVGRGAGTHGRGAVAGLAVAVVCLRCLPFTTARPTRVLIAYDHEIAVMAFGEQAADQPEGPRQFGSSASKPVAA